MAMMQNSFKKNINYIQEFFLDFETVFENVDGQNEIEDIDHKIQHVLNKRKAEYDIDESLTNQVKDKIIRIIKEFA